MYRHKEIIVNDVLQMIYLAIYSLFNEESM